MFDCDLDCIIRDLPEIKAQGFDAVQISPLQNTKDDKSLAWWMLYQPLNFNLGNRIGDAKKLEKLCKEAEKKGLFIIADVVFNHLASTDYPGSLEPNSRCDKEILRNPDCFKERRNIENWEDRFQVTHYCMSLPGLNPNNKLVQKKVIDMLNHYIDLGVQGFRFDAAKSIALPEEGCDFFTNVTYAMSKWLPVIYGEVLFCNQELIDKYAKYMKVLTNSESENTDAVVKFCENKDFYLSNDMGQTKYVGINEINGWYSGMCAHYPNTLYYARNYCMDWNSWKSPEIRKANMQLKLSK